MLKVQMVKRWLQSGACGAAQGTEGGRMHPALHDPYPSVHRAIDAAQARNACM